MYVYCLFYSSYVRNIGNRCLAMLTFEVKFKKVSFNLDDVH